MTEAPILPNGVYFSIEHSNFYDAYSGRGLGTEFYEKWRERRSLFPTSAAEALGLSNLGMRIAVQFRGATMNALYVERLALDINREVAALAHRAEALTTEVRGAWARLEDASFPPEMMGWPFEDIEGRLPTAIAAAISELTRAREDMMRQRDHALRERASMVAGMVAGAQYVGVLAGALRLDQEQPRTEREDR